MEKQLKNKAIELFGDIDSITLEDAKKKRRELVKKLHPDNNKGVSYDMGELLKIYQYVKNHISHMQRLRLAYQKCKLDICINEINKEHQEVNNTFKKSLKEFSLADDVVNELKDKLDKKLSFILFGHKNTKKKLLNFILLYLMHLVIVMFGIFYLDLTTATVPIICTVSSCIFLILFAISINKMYSLKKDIKETRRYKNKIENNICDLHHSLLNLEIEKTICEEKLTSVNESLSSISL